MNTLNENMKIKEEEKTTEEDKAESRRVLKDNELEVIKRFSIEGLDQHNKSLEWLVERASEKGAEFNPIVERYGREPGFDIQFNSPLTGIRYSITVALRERIAKFLSSRISQVDFQTPGAATSIGPLFSRLFEVDASWWNPADNQWTRMCTEDWYEWRQIDLERRAIWPSDNVLSLFLSLHDDFRTSLEESQDSFQSHITKAVPMYWFAGESPENMSFDQMSVMASSINIIRVLTRYHGYDYTQVQALIYGMLANPEPDYSEYAEKLARIIDEMSLEEE